MNFFSLIWCIGPMGFSKGIYQYGKPLPCDVEKINMSTCLKAKLSQVFFSSFTLSFFL